MTKLTTLLCQHGKQLVEIKNDFGVPIFPCNHMHIDESVVGATKNRLLQKVKAIYEFRIDEKGERNFSEGRFLSKEELVQERSHRIIKYIPLIQRERKGRRLLSHCISAEQWKEYVSNEIITVFVGGYKYKIGGYKGVKEYTNVNEKWFHVATYCLHGESSLPQSDVLLMQKILIENDLPTFLKRANVRYTPFHSSYLSSDDAYLDRLDRENPQELVRVINERIRQNQHA